VLSKENCPDLLSHPVFEYVKSLLDEDRSSFHRKEMIADEQQPVSMPMKPVTMEISIR